MQAIRKETPKPVWGLRISHPPHVSGWYADDFEAILASGSTETPGPPFNYLKECELGATPIRDYQRLSVDLSVGQNQPLVTKHLLF